MEELDKHGVGRRYSKLGADWQLGDDGIRWRRGARVLVIDNAPWSRYSTEPNSTDGEESRVLLIRGHDADQPSRSWWFAVGGGIDAGETAHQAAVRELREETGLVLAPEQVIGPVLRRSAIFDFFAESCRQDEEFFVAYLPGASQAATGMNRAGWTDVERELLDEIAWLTPNELRNQPLEFFPRELPEIVERLAHGWDGTIVHLGRQDDDEAWRDSQ